MIALHTLSAVLCLAYGVTTDDIWASMFSIGLGVVNLYVAIIGSIEHD
jgi:hypothetical protein